MIEQKLVIVFSFEYIGILLKLYMFENSGLRDKVIGEQGVFKMFTLVCLHLFYIIMKCIYNIDINKYLKKLIKIIGLISF